jgi:2-iminobutanoate/2-iminopropanoate deaminase
MPRQSIEIDTFAHQNPIPAATRIGPLVVSSIIPSFNPGTRDVPGTTEEQLENLFLHVGKMLEGAGASWADMARMTFYVSDASVRDAINGPWAERFPDAASRPSRYTQVVAGPAGMVSCDFLAYVEDGDDG